MRATVLQLSRTDPLTGLYNRGQLFPTLEQEVQRTRRSERGFCLLMIDLDGLKAVNDSLWPPSRRRGAPPPRRRHPALDPAGRHRLPLWRRRVPRPAARDRFRRRLRGRREDPRRDGGDRASRRRRRAADERQHRPRLVPGGRDDRRGADDRRRPGHVPGEVARQEPGQRQPSAAPPAIQSSRCARGGRHRPAGDDACRCSRPCGSRRCRPRRNRRRRRSRLRP